METLLHLKTWEFCQCTKDCKAWKGNNSNQSWWEGGEASEHRDKESPRQKNVFLHQLASRHRGEKISSAHNNDQNFFNKFWCGIHVQAILDQIVDWRGWCRVHFSSSLPLLLGSALLQDASSTRPEMYEVVVYSLLSQRMCSFKETKLRSQSAAGRTTTDRACVYCWV